MAEYDGLQPERSALAIIPTKPGRLCCYGWDSSLSSGCYRDADYDVADPWWFLADFVFAVPRCGYHAQSDFLAVLREVYQRAAGESPSRDGRRAAPSASPAAPLREPESGQPPRKGEGAKRGLLGLPASSRRAS